MNETPIKENQEEKPKLRVRNYEYNPTKNEYFNRAYTEYHERSLIWYLKMWGINKSFADPFEQEVLKFRPHQQPFLSRMIIVFCSLLFGRLLQTYYIKTLEVKLFIKNQYDVREKGGPLTIEDGFLNNIALHASYSLIQGINFIIGILPGILKYLERPKVLMIRMEFSEFQN